MSFRTTAEKWKDEAIRLRRHIHQNPELGHQEFETAKLVAQFLLEAGLEVQTGVGGTGVVGLLKGERDGEPLESAPIWMPCLLRRRPDCRMPALAKV